MSLASSTWSKVPPGRSGKISMPIRDTQVRDGVLIQFSFDNANNWWQVRGVWCVLLMSSISNLDRANCCLHVAWANHFWLINSQYDRNDVEYCVSNNNDGLRLNDCDDDHDSEKYSECEQQLSIVPISSQETDKAHNQLYHHDNNLVGVAPMSLQLGR